MAVDLSLYIPQSPMWWVSTLYRQLVARRPHINKWDDYYRGLFPLPWLATDAQDEFRRILKMARANYMGLVIDAQCERMAVDGFRLSLAPGNRGSTGAGADPDDPIADDEIARIWEANSMDTQFDQGLLEAAITGVSYILVAPNEDDRTTPYWYVEHSSQTIIAFKSGTNRQEALAALKVYVDEWTGQTFAVLYLPKWIYKFQTSGAMQHVPILPGFIPLHASEILEMPVWEFRESTDITPQRNPLDVVPMFECPNNPRLLSGGQSEIYDLTDSQDRIIKTLADRLMTQDYGAFPQKWASGWPTEDENGNPIPAIKVGRTRMLTTDIAESRFGQFDAADLMGYIQGKTEDVKDIASRSRTPAQYLLGEMNNVNGDTLKASESGLVAKVRQRFRGHNPALTGSATLIRKMAGLGDLKSSGRRYETIWRNPEFRTEGELVDALLKMADLGVPEQALWERWGATPAEIERWQGMLEDKMARAAAGDATVVLADRFRQAAQGAGAPAGGAGGAAPPGGTGTQTGSPTSQRQLPKPNPNPGGRGSQSGGTSSANAAKRRPNAPSPATV